MEDKINKIVKKMSNWERLKFIFWAHINKEKALKIFRQYEHNL